MANKEVHIGDDWYLGENNAGDLIFYNSRKNEVVKAIDVITGAEDKKGNSLKNVSTAHIKKTMGYFYAPRYADGGSGSTADPYTNCIYNIVEEIKAGARGAIIVPYGRFEENNKILYDTNAPSSHLSIIGYGFWNSKIILGDAFDDTWIKVDDSRGLYIQGITIDGNKANQTVANPILNFSTGKDHTLKDTFITSSKGAGVKLQDWAGVIQNCPIEYCEGNAIEAEGTNWVVRDCTLSHNFGYAVSQIGGEIKVIDNRIGLDNGDGFYFGATAPTISSTKILGNEIGNPSATSTVLTFDGDYNTPKGIIAGNNFGSAQYGIDFNGGTPDILITDNYFGDVVNITDGISNMRFADTEGALINNPGLNPIGLITDVFHSSWITPHGWGDPAPSANQDYLVTAAPVRIISTGGTGVSITITDMDGNTVKSGLSTLDRRLPIGRTINFGGFSAAPSVDVYFE